MTDEYLQAVAAIAAVILQRTTTHTGAITEEDVKQAARIAERGLYAAAREIQGSSKKP